MLESLGWPKFIKHYNKTFKDRLSHIICNYCVVFFIFLKCSRFSEASVLVHLDLGASDCLDFLPVLNQGVIS